MTDYQVRLRLFIFQLSIITLFSLFAIQLWRLQILQGQKYQQLADRNRFRSVEIEAPRGIIYDVNNNLLVRNRPIFNVVIVPAYLPEDTTAQTKVFATLANLLQLPITNGGMRELANHNAYFRSFLHHEYTRLPNRQVKNSRSRLLENSPQGIKDAIDNAPPFAPYQPVLIATDVDPQVAAIIEEDRLNLPGVFVETSSKRDYLTGELTSAILGYVGPIPPSKVDRYVAPDYSPNDQVGLIGLEANYEDHLHGIKGREIIEVDVTGRKIKTIGDALAAQPGNNLILSLDLDLQKFATEKLQEAIDDSTGQSGATIVMNPQNGEILALVSLPGYDNNLFADGISAREFSLLSEDERTPLVNKAISGLYPPGSTYKIVVTSGAIQEQVVTPDQQFFDAGILYLPNQFYPDDLDLAQPFYCWLRTGHELVNSISALAFSCDVYYYQVGGGYEPTGFEGLGLSKMIEYAELFGFGSPTEIDIPGEGSGLVPDAKWKRLNYAETWLTGDTYNMSIGQGFVLSTPLQVLNAFAAIGNGGTLYKPRLLKEIRNPQKELIYKTKAEVLGKLNLNQETMSVLDQGLRGVIEWGTAKEVIYLPGISVAGKTGTAEFCDRYPQCLDRDGRVRTSHAWFVAYAPAVDPQIAAVTFVYGGGEGSLTAAPVVNAIFRYYFQLDQLDDSEDNTTSAADISPDTAFNGRLLGSDTYAAKTAAVTGLVVDSKGRGIPEIAINITADGELIDQIFSGPSGQFDYTTLQPNLTPTWQVTLADYPDSSAINLTISAGTRYFIEFQALETNHE